MNTLSSPLPRLRAAVLVVLSVLALLVPLKAKDKTDRSPMLRIVCVTALSGHDESILASGHKKGKLREEEKVGLRSSLITEWLAVPQEKLDLCVRDDRELVSKCSFTYPPGARRAILILLPDGQEDRYTAHVIDTAKQKLGTGDILVLNTATLPCVVKLGEKEVEAKPGEILVIKPSLDENGMFRTLVTYTDEDGNVATSNDVFTPGTKTGRDFFVLSPDPHVGIRVASLSESGPFE